MIRIRTAPALVAAFAFALIAGPVPAAAKVYPDRYQTLTKDVAVPDGQSRSVRLACPSGKRIASGGATWRGGTFWRGYLEASYPVRAGRAWVARGTSNTSGAKLRVIIHCVADKAVGPLTVVRDASAVLTTTDPDQRFATALCPPDMQVVTAGARWEMASEPGVAISDVYLAGLAILEEASAVEASGFAFGPVGARLVAIATCAPVTKLGASTSVFRTIVADEPLKATVRCPVGRGVVAGGAFAVHDSSVKGNYLGHSAPTEDAQGWSSAVLPLGSGDPVFTLQAQCRPRSPG